MTKPIQQLVRFDWAIKSILRDKANFDVLEGFLTCFLKEKITIEELLESESNKTRPEFKINRVDLKCKDSKGKQIIIEVQNQFEADYLYRVLFGTSKALVESMKISEGYLSVPKIISISILHHAVTYPERNKDYIYHGTNNIIGLHTNEPMIVKDGTTLLPTDSVAISPEYYIICTANFNDEIKEEIDEWVYFLKNSRIEDIFNAPGIKAAQKKLDYLSMTKVQQAVYDAYMDGSRYEQNSIRDARREGEEEGFKNGFEDGKEEGFKDGEEKGFKDGELSAKNSLARNLLAMGAFSLEQVAQGTGLSVEDVKKLAMP